MMALLGISWASLLAVRETETGVRRVPFQAMVNASSLLLSATIDAMELMRVQCEFLK